MLSVDDVAEGSTKFIQSIALLAHPVFDMPNMTIGVTIQQFLHIKMFEYVPFDFLNVTHLWKIHK
jgi:hypothetical protein